MEIKSTMLDTVSRSVHPQTNTQTNQQQTSQEPKKSDGREVSLDTLEHKIESMNDLLSTTPTSIKFNLHKDLDRIYVQVVDLQTKEVVKEIPPEEFLDMVASMLKNAGLIVDERI
ncbi:flagellar protein FlaG [Alkalicoccobacillus porphyridii]|uniref:Flagellar biosynthesis protein FlaG n=1 Tax=Alkalicoccobacillus porphyridii TaxID=2597270 RepID=A0A554A3V3_9BACI|nr:flagellar protein FlaG [Alkalicoccobacillus porphyridii]TSB48336.1 flagellar biosynthesis protein FlaG [Alkalicoccobacillus porphyridii]